MPLEYFLRDQVLTRHPRVEQFKIYNNHRAERLILLFTHSTKRMQSLNFYYLPELPSTTTKQPSENAPTKLSPPILLLPVFPPIQPWPINLLVFSIKRTRLTIYPSLFIYLLFSRYFLVELILENKGTLKHSEAILATSSAEQRLEEIPCTFMNVNYFSFMVIAYLFIKSRKMLMLASRFSGFTSKQLKYSFCLFLATQLPRLLAIAVAMLLAEPISKEQRESQSVISIYSLSGSGNLVPPILLSSGVTIIQNLLMLMQFSFIISQAVQKVSNLVMLAMSCCSRYLQPLMMPDCMLQMSHFLAVTWLKVISLSHCSFLGMELVALLKFMG